MQSPLTRRTGSAPSASRPSTPSTPPTGPVSRRRKTRRTPSSASWSRATTLRAVDREPSLIEPPGSVRVHVADVATGSSSSPRRAAAPDRPSSSRWYRIRLREQPGVLRRRSPCGQTPTRVLSSHWARCPGRVHGPLLHAAILGRLLAPSGNVARPADERARRGRRYSARWLDTQTSAPYYQVKCRGAMVGSRSAPAAAESLRDDPEPHLAAVRVELGAKPKGSRSEGKVVVTTALWPGRARRCP